MLCGILSVGAFAQGSRPAHPSGSVSIHQMQVAFIGSGAVGGGTLYFGGRSYPFKLGSLGIGGFGVSKLDATGSVYNLSRLQDFEGVYGRLVPDGLWASTAKATCGCRIPTAYLFA